MMKKEVLEFITKKFGDTAIERIKWDLKEGAEIEIKKFAPEILDTQTGIFLHELEGKRRRSFNVIKWDFTIEGVPTSIWFTPNGHHMEGHDGPKTLKEGLKEKRINIKDIRALIEFIQIDIPGEPKIHKVIFHEI
jgi:hypothetical protein